METITISWCAEDLQSLRPELSINQAQELLMKFSKPLTDRSTEEGWQILRDLLSIEGV
jgi:hypothetical protein